MMHYQEALQTLENLGTDQNRKIYRRHGVGENQYGVSYANLEKLRKQIKKDDPLAVQLWDSGNHDARILATLIADPNQLNAARIETWAASLDNYVQGDALVKLLGKTPAARPLAERWVDSPDELLSRSGWHLLAGLALNDQTLPDSYFEAYLARIEDQIHTAPNRTREAMNNTLIAIGIRSAGLETAATAAARRIGPLHIDHGETNCKTPDAIPYIQKARARQANRSLAG